MEKSTSSTLMTEGSIWKKIIAFAVPLFLGNLFQQLYNTADSLIVGNFLGSNALAAVSSSGNLIFLMVGFVSGIAIGAGVVIARYYGAGRHGDVQKAVHTTIAFGLVWYWRRLFWSGWELRQMYFRNPPSISARILQAPCPSSCTTCLSASCSPWVTAAIRWSISLYRLSSTSCWILCWWGSFTLEWGPRRLPLLSPSLSARFSVCAGS